MTTLRLSVIIPNLDSPWIGETLQALREQGVPGPAQEVVVVGRDHPGLVPRDGSVRLVTPEKDLNPAAARNLGVTRSRGDLALFLDADCFPRPGWVEAMTRALAEVPIAGGAVTFPRRGNVWALADNIASFHELLEDRPREMATHRPLGGLNLGFRREAWEQVGPLNEELPTSEDFDWVLRARRAGLATAFLPEAVVEHAAVRRTRQEVEAHAAWYGRHFREFLKLHPGVLATGPTWRSRRQLALAAPVKAVVASLLIFLRHPSLAGCWRAFPGVVVFKRAWYRAVLESWAEG